MKLPGADHVIVDVTKVHDDCLDPHHLRGRDKARVFASALGLTQADAEILRGALLAAAREDNAVPGNSDEYGERYTIDFQMKHGGRLSTIRSAWIILSGEQSPRLTSCFVL